MFYFTHDSLIRISLFAPIFYLLKDHIYFEASPMMYLSHVLLMEFIVLLTCFIDGVHSFTKCCSKWLFDLEQSVVAAY